MNQKMDKENAGATITELVAKTEKEGSQFFKSADEKGDTQATIHDDVSPQLPPQEARKVYIEEILRKKNMLVQGSELGQVYSD
jgi:hypothetical protein